jgi:hypothetical protein
MMFRRQLEKLKRHIVTDVPVDLQACIDCDAIQCLNETYVACPRRLERVKDLTEAAGGEADHGSPAAPVRTG